MKILILQSRMGIGDMVIYLPFIEAIAKKFETKVDILVKQNSKAIEIIGNNQFIENIIYLKRSGKNERHDGVSGFINLIKDIKKYNFDKIFIFNSSLRYNLIARLSGIKEIYQYPLFQKKNQHIINEAKSFLKNNLNIDVETKPEIILENFEILDAKKNYKIDDKIINVLLGTGGSGPNKRIPSKIYKSIINLCKKKYNCRFFIATGKNEDEQQILNDIIEDDGKYTRLDNLSINKILPVIKNCSISICNDTSFSHLSAALNIPTIILFADTATLYGSYNPIMFPISADNSNETENNLHPKERINPKVVFETFNKILTNSNH